MTVLRTRRNQRKYNAYMAHRPKGCDFCQIQEGHAQFLKETESFKIIHNRFPYAYWDDQTVADHLMVVPKEHTGSLTSFTPDQAVEYLALISDYENNGYHVYARAVKSVSRTITHQHTHLIKGKGKPKWFVVQMSKPYILIAR
jgi:diadenosine tetraphosphate (Ap4A) HIT family hydrolase